MANISGVFNYLFRQGKYYFFFFVATFYSSISFASQEGSAFYDAAICNPPYTIRHATELNDEAEKLVKPDTSLMTAYVYKLPFDIGRDGFKTNEVVFSGTMVGVLIDGWRADELAKHYQLEREESNILGTSLKGYARVVQPDPEKPSLEFGRVSIIARESNAIPGKTMLGCEFVSDAELDRLKQLEKHLHSANIQ
ncbi:hypothetical protein ACE60T_005861 [Salmonella enterica]